ncbi:MAG: phosphoesterase RecJ-like protein [Saprospiraceae bacterium]|jgi:phosphoesterase RecJ-like protein
MDNIAEIKERLRVPSNVVILAHRNPDGDAIGSSIALKLFLEQYGQHCKVLLPSEYPNIFEYLPAREDIIIYDLNREEGKKALESAEIICCLDFNSLDRIDPLAMNITESKAYKILIDHHLDPEPFADWYFSDTESSSTCELIYRFIEALDATDKVTLDMATCIFTGILTDTGSFKYATNPNVYRIASELKKIGLDDYAINDNIFNSWTKRQMIILGHALRNRLEVIPEMSAGIITLTQQDYQKYHIGRGDTEGLVNYILMIKGMKVAAFVRQMTNSEIRLSLRSKGDISVQNLARDHFSGGGHKNASGGSSKLSLADTVEKFKEVLPHYL